MPGKSIADGGSGLVPGLEHPLTMKYARQRQKERRVAEWATAAAARVLETATVAASQPEVTTQSCHNCCCCMQQTLCSLLGRLGEKLMKSHKSQTSGTLCTFYELLLLLPLLLLLLALCAELRSMPSGRQSPQIWKALKRHLALKRPGLNLNCSTTTKKRSLLALRRLCRCFPCSKGAAGGLCS